MNMIAQKEACIVLTNIQVKKNPLYKKKQTFTHTHVKSFFISHQINF